MSGFDPNRSQVSGEALAAFLSADVNEDLMSVPGIGAASAAALTASDETDGGVATTFQLIGKFLLLKGPGMTSGQHCDAFWYYLKLKGVNAHRSGIVKAVAEKVNVAFPGIYTP